MGATEVTRKFISPGLSTSGYNDPGWKAEAASWAEITRLIGSQGSGYLRLFVDEPRYQDFLAVIDPDLKSLRVSSGLFGG